MTSKHSTAVSCHHNSAWSTALTTAAGSLLLMAAACGAEAVKPTAPSQASPATAAPSVGAAGTPAANSMNAPKAGQSAAAPAATAPAAPKAMQTSAPATTNTAAAMPVGAAGTGAANPAEAENGASAAGSGGSETPTTSGGCLDTVTDFSTKGPFEFELKMDGPVFMWVPKVPAGCKIPVTHLANGTGAGCMNYEEINSHLASHGFLASCYDNPNTGAGDQGVMALEKVFELYPDLADKKIGSTGHSQGGQASFIVLQKAEAKFGPDYTYCGLAMEPASGFGAQPSGGTWASFYGMIKSPMFMFSGTADALVSAAWVGSAYQAMGDIEAYWWSAIGATHVPTPDAHTMQVAVPWFRWKLLGDKKACEAFKALPDTDQWDAVQSKNEAPCE